MEHFFEDLDGITLFTSLKI